MYFKLSRTHLFSGMMLLVLLMLSSGTFSRSEGSEAKVNASSSLTLQILSKEQGLPSRFPRSLAYSSPLGLFAGFRTETNTMDWYGVALLASSGIRLFPDSRPSSLQAGISDPYPLLSGPDGSIWEGTPNGLRRFDVGSQTFFPLGATKSFSHLALGPNQTLWAAGVQNNHKLLVSAFDGKSFRQFPGKFFCREIRGLYPQSADQISPPGGVPATGGQNPLQGRTQGADSKRGTKGAGDSTGFWGAFVVSSDEILKVGPKGIKPVDLGNTPLWTKPNRDPDGPRPAVWIYASAQTPNGAIFLVGHTKKLVRWADNQFTCIAEGHFSHLIPGSTGEELFVSDFEGNLHYWDGKRFGKLFSSPGGHIGSMNVSPDGHLWVAEETSHTPHSILRFSPPFDITASNPERLSLGIGDGFLSPGVLGMTHDGAHGIWISTNKGLWHIQPTASENK